MRDFVKSLAFFVVGCKMIIAQKTSTMCKIYCRFDKNWYFCNPDNKNNSNT